MFRDRAGLLFLSVGGLLLGTCLNLAGPWLLAQAIDVDIAQGDLQGLQRRAALYLAVIASTLTITYVSRIGMEIAAQEAMRTLKVHLFDHLVRHDLAFHDRLPSGKLITRVQGDTESLRMLFTEVILSTPADLSLFVGMFVVISLNAPQIALPVFAILPAYVLAFVAFRSVAPRYYLAVRRIKAILTGFLTEHLRAMPILRQMGRDAWARERAEALNVEVFKTEAVSGLIGTAYFNGIFLIRAAGMVFLLWYGAHQVAAGALTLGALVLGLGYIRQMFSPLMRLSHHLNSIERARSAAIRIAEILDLEPELTSPPQPAPWPGVRDAIRVEGVDFHYVEGTPVLRGIDMEIPAGQRVGIVGATGSGKSTLLNLLLRFRDPIRGAITVDGVPLRDLPLDTVRDKMGLVLQDVHLFPGTVLDNLGGDEAAAQRALDYLGIRIPVDTVLGEGGAGLSRGERQLITFARALVRSPEVLVLDEATSAVDPGTEARVQEALERLQRDRTTIIVAHRLATVRNCDRIYVLAGGEVREVGTHEDLLAQGGIYAALTQLQSGVAA